MGLPYGPKNDTTQVVDTYTSGEDLVKGSAGTLAGPLVWSGADFKDDRAYTLRLGHEDVLEIDNALAEFHKLGLDGDKVSPSNFPLPNLGRRLRTCTQTIHLGRGFIVLRGIDADRYKVEDTIIIFLGLASYIAEKRGLQDRKGTMLAHVTESKLWTVPANLRHGIHTNEALPFHTDMGCDILSLQVRDCAVTGGYTYLSSTWSVFNDLLNREPEVVKTLLTPNWPVQIPGRRNLTYYLAPVFLFHDGKLLASLDPHRLGPHPAVTNAKIPTLNSDQLHALQAVSESAARAELQLTLNKGDILFFNNLALLHRRDRYQDDENTSRHLVRLWLRSQKLGWAIPSAFLPPWKAAYGENRKIVKRLYPPVPLPVYPEQRYTTGSAAFVFEEDSDLSDSE
ncbi:hypothetical protein EDB81DRAFT_648748 [Dactylonectria macrodidyma]|uniref:TauD/TfdA-like domain-containing protein n=1 Tax=Dactylonectria macrodidyma TaxID=307937 RepID=A0A9P9F384_9HYPO|nr:hypothetical protein EDB81DRAFT_648748 [Dactylonectria macrodidyma]